MCQLLGDPACLCARAADALFRYVQAEPEPEPAPEEKEEAAPAEAAEEEADGDINTSKE